MTKTRVGVVGYGNLGRGVVLALRASDDLELAAIFTRRDPAALAAAEGLTTPVVGYADLDDWRDRLDVLILCGGSATDLPEQTPALAAGFNVVDSFDNHQRIPAHFAAVDAAARLGGTVAAIAVGWDPGLFSLNRLYAEAVLQAGSSATFWGPGVSQGHSDAIRRLPGVIDARQYTVPLESAVAAARAGGAEGLSPRERHLRRCYVVAADGADQGGIEHAIKTMPDYFAPYDTTVTFVTAEELARDHAGLPHGGFVIRSGTTGSAQTGAVSSQVIEYQLTLGSNPEFTSSVLVAYARAVARLAAAGQAGAHTVFDIAPGLLSPRDPADLRSGLL